MFSPILQSTLPIIGTLLTASSYAQGLNITAIVGVHGASTFQCWTLSAPPFQVVGTTIYPIGGLNKTGSTLSVVPAGWHFEPSFAYNPAFAVVLTGTIHVRLLKSNEELWIQGGRYGMIIETDTRDKIRYGHIDDVVGGENALVLDFPFAGGVLPDYELLHEGACTIWEMSGL